MEPKRVHSIGICGMGMSAVALLLKEAGYDVTGSDAECYGPPGDTLARGGITPILSYGPENIPPHVSFFVTGRNAKLDPAINTEVRAALASGVPVYSFAETLGNLTHDRTNVVVAGSYGKSTTTSLIAHILRHAGVDAGYFVGAEPVSLGKPCALGTHPTFVLEGDEYPSAHDDARAKFMHLHPTDVVLTAVVHDHVNVYPTFESYQKPFGALLATLPETGLVVVCADEPGALSIAQASHKPLVTYGVHTGTYHAEHIVFGHETTFDLVGPEHLRIPLTTSLLGAHNVEDIVGACAYVLSRELVTPAALPEAVQTFTGVRRRLDNITPHARIPVFEGFGSSYEKARSAMSAINLHYPTNRLVVVFEPHTFGWRNRANLTWYDDVFTEAALVLIAPPETQGAHTHDQLSHNEIMARVQAAGVHAETYDVHDVTKNVAVLNDGDVVLVLTSGDLEGTLPAFARAVENQFTA